MRIACPSGCCALRSSSAKASYTGVVLRTRLPLVSSFKIVSRLSPCQMMSDDVRCYNFPLFSFSSILCTRTGLESDILSRSPVEMIRSCTKVALRSRRCRSPNVARRRLCSSAANVPLTVVACRCQSPLYAQRLVRGRLGQTPTAPTWGRHRQGKGRLTSILRSKQSWGASQ